MTIRQKTTFKATAQAMYDALLNSETFATITGAPAEIATDEGGKFSCFGGQITGRQVELQPDRRIVQAWRAGPWDESVYSIVTFEIQSTSSESTTIELTHSGFPDGAEEHLQAGWEKMYWEPMQKHFS